jgi:hypothetical protein
MSGLNVVRRFLDLFGSRAWATYRDDRVVCVAVGQRQSLECAVNRRGVVRLRVPGAELIVSIRGRVYDIAGNERLCALLIWVYESVCPASKQFASDSEVRALRTAEWTFDAVSRWLDEQE